MHEGTLSLSVHRLSGASLILGGEDVVPLRLCLCFLLLCFTLLDYDALFGYFDRWF